MLQFVLVVLYRLFLHCAPNGQYRYHCAGTTSVHISAVADSARNGVAITAKPMMAFTHCCHIYMYELRLVMSTGGTLGSAARAHYMLLCIK